MKIRNGFVSNSSSTAFIMTNLSNIKKSLVDFVKETPELIENFIEDYDWNRDDPDYTQENLINSAKENNIFFEPEEEKYVVFGDEQGTLIGRIYDYILRSGVDSENFKVRVEEYLR